MWTAKLKEDENGDLILIFPEKLLKQLGWKEGTAVAWSDNLNGTFTLVKEEK